ncbi:UbiA family prenyltransferase [Chlorobium sp. BLA1]|uniref:UbiA family prenyltransferase n=1 Tax=Candidatus Chlorobium masyuteum TaxID=2716876 RepID=UPI00141EE65B|nr:UbiA family prenyltransferase [Candidatus Chlorobium masyuteum]NHQ60000.1 UbiA family prenyltransferase [Candidatus Chlorobium masyuteum]
MTKPTLIGLYRLFRFELSSTAGACALLGELLALGYLPSFRQAALGFLTIFCISATALILNDFFDIETDRINAPYRPLPSGLVSKAEALLLATVVALLGFLSGWMIGVEAFALVLVVWIAGFLYNWRLKKSGIIGNLIVGFSVGMTFVFGGIMVGNPFEKIVWFLALTTMFVDLGEEIAADALDVEGDRKTGSRSLAVRFGPERAMRIAAGIFSLVIAGSAIPFVFGWLEWLYLPPIVIFDGVIIYSARRLLNPKIPDRINDIRRIYLSGSVMIVVFIIIRLAITAR